MKEIYESLFYQYLRENEKNFKNQIENNKEEYTKFLKLKIKQLKEEIKQLKEEIENNETNLKSKNNYQKRYEERKWEKY